MFTGGEWDFEVKFWLSIYAIEFMTYDFIYLFTCKHFNSSFVLWLCDIDINYSNHYDDVHIDSAKVFDDMPESTKKFLTVFLFSQMFFEILIYKVQYLLILNHIYIRHK